MTAIIAIIGGIASGLLATAGTILLLNRLAILDVPNQRSSHTKTTPRGGGIGVAIGTLVGLAISHTNLVGSTWIAAVVASLAFGLIGLADDLKGAVPVSVRLALQLIVSIGLSIVICQHGSHILAIAILASALVTLWITAFVNVFNFMDGINGISCAQTIIAGLTYGLIARHEHQIGLEAASFALVAGAIGFLPFNFPIARVFLGDVGSYFLGTWLAVLVVVGLRRSIPFEAMVAPLALYIADTGITLTHRMLRHEAWLQAHHNHTYQRLIDLGLSHTQTTGLVSTIVAMCSALGLESLGSSDFERVAADCGIVILICGYLALPHIVNRSRSHSQCQIRNPQG